MLPYATTFYCHDVWKSHKGSVAAAKQLSNVVGQNRWLELLLWPPARHWHHDIDDSWTQLVNALSVKCIRRWKRDTLWYTTVNQICWVAAQFNKVESSRKLAPNPSWYLLCCAIVHLDILQKTASGSCTLISVEHLSRAKRALGGTTSA